MNRQYRAVTTPGAWPGHSALVVPVPALEPLVRARHQFYDTAYVSADPTFAHAHVTVLAPFVALDALSPTIDPHDARPAITMMAEIASRRAPFELTFRRVATFPNGIVHLVTEPADPLRELTAQVRAAFPELIPYAGVYGTDSGDVASHLTIDALGPGVTEQIVRDWVADQLPVQLIVDRVQVSWYEAWACRTVVEWPLGPAVPATARVSAEDPPAPGLGRPVGRIALPRNAQGLIRRSGKLSLS